MTQARNAVLRVFFMLFVLSVTSSVSAQDDFKRGLIVDEPQLSRSTFTNWDDIRITYPVRYLDGYEPQYDKGPSAASFAPFELLGEPEYQKTHKVGRENYEEWTYHLRYAGKEKEEMEVPEQTFYYLKLQASKDKKDLELRSFKSPVFKLKYVSVLTKEADDIKDPIDLGSYQSRSYRLIALSILGFLCTASAVIVLGFRKPIVAVAEHQGRLERVRSRGASRKEFLAAISSGTPLNVARFHQALRRLIQAYSPDVLNSDTARDIVQKLKVKPADSEVLILQCLAGSLLEYEDSETGRSQQKIDLVTEHRDLKALVDKLGWRQQLQAELHRLYTDLRRKRS